MRCRDPEKLDLVWGHIYGYRNRLLVFEVGVQGDWPRRDCIIRSVIHHAIVPPFLQWLATGAGTKNSPTAIPPEPTVPVATTFRPSRPPACQPSCKRARFSLPRPPCGHVVAMLHAKAVLPSRGIQAGLMVELLPACITNLDAVEKV
jgi:hypothetical protein